MNQMKSNKGTSLVELMIAIGMLALVASAIIGVMSTNTAIYKRSQRDLTVQVSAQETYDRLMDDIMKATNVQIKGYKVPKGTGTDNDGNPVHLVDFKPSEKKKVDDSLKDDFEDADFISLKSDKDPEFDKNTDISFKDFSSDSDKYELYLTELVLDFAVDDKTIRPDNNVSNYEGIYCRDTFTFEDENLKLNQKYFYTSYGSDHKLSSHDMPDYDTASYSGTDKYGDPSLFSSYLNYINVGTKDNPRNISGAVMDLDVENQAASIDIYFADLSMSYTSRGMVKIRNSRVLVNED